VITYVETRPKTTSGVGKETKGLGYILRDMPYINIKTH
jgi:hypothetical protein